MSLARPRSLSALLLVGLAIIALPLIAALLTAAYQMRKLSENSEALVVEGVQATRLTQDLFAQIVSLERTVRLYQVLEEDRLLQAYRQQDQRLAGIVAQLGQQLRSHDAREALTALANLQRDIAEQVLAPGNARSGADRILANFENLDSAASRVSERGNAQIDADLSALRVATARAQRTLFWESALLVPLTLAAILVFTFGIGRPLRQIDRAIDELGRGAFFRPIRVTGPLDLERLGRQLEWLRQRLLDFAQERNRFLRHMSHELKTPL
ncbi:MAG: hypothetical protein ABW136_07775, partial [Steroidobacteraceae bacterium]